MGFHDPQQHQHKIAGIKAALASSKTPAHLRPHLEKQLQEAGAMNSKMPKSKKAMNDNDGDETMNAKPAVFQKASKTYPGPGVGSKATAKPKKNPQGKSVKPKKNMLYGC